MPSKMLSSQKNPRETTSEVKAQSTKIGIQCFYPVFPKITLARIPRFATSFCYAQKQLNNVTHF